MPGALRKAKMAIEPMRSSSFQSLGDRLRLRNCILVIFGASVILWWGIWWVIRLVEGLI